MLSHRRKINTLQIEPVNPSLSSMYEEDNDVPNSSTSLNLEDLFSPKSSQLSNKGLALLSYYESLPERKDQINQPLIADSTDDLERIASFMAIKEVPVGSQVRIIFRAGDYNCLVYEDKIPFEQECFQIDPLNGHISIDHKTVLLLEKTEKGVNLLCMDSISDKKYGILASRLIYNAMNANFSGIGQENNNDKMFEVNVYFEHGTLMKQTDKYTCGTFSVELADGISSHFCFNQLVATPYDSKANPPVGLNEYRYNPCSPNLPNTYYKGAMSPRGQSTYLGYLTMNADKHDKVLFSYKKYEARQSSRVVSKVKLHKDAVTEMFQTLGPEQCLQHIRKYSASSISFKQFVSHVAPNYIALNLKNKL